MIFAVLLFIPATSVSAETYLPGWVKNVFVWYGKSQVSEAEVLQSIEWLIENDILKVDQHSKDGVC